MRGCGVRRCGGAFLVACFVLAASAATAQELIDEPSLPPGPYVIDVRGAMASIPKLPAFYPPFESGTIVPARGFGFDVGAHIYPFTLGRARVGFGANVVRAQGRLVLDEVEATVTTVTPQISFNFGSRDGWSYLSAGYGTAAVRSSGLVRESLLAGVPDTRTGSLENPMVTGTADSGLVRALNYGGGARWFLSSHIAAGFDLRFHRLSAGATTPKATLAVVSAGVSIR